MSKKKKAAADFRYDTGAARIPWAAVGETVKNEETARIVEFLMPPAPGKTRAHKAQLKRTLNELTRLSQVSGGASKLSLGSHVTALEQQCARFLKSKYTSFVTNATAGFEMAHKFAGLKPGDEVIVPAITFIATMAYPLSIGAKIVIADVDPRTINMDPADVARKITKRTKVIVPVHIGGYPVDMDPIMRLARKHDIMVLEDAAHAFGARYKGKMVGTIGHFGSFSFHEVKNVNALGEGGILTTNTKYGKQFAQARFLGVDMSSTIKNWLYDISALAAKDGVSIAGNHSSTEIQALCLATQITRLKQIITQRKKAASYLNRRFKQEPAIITPLLDTADIKSTHHLYLLQIDPAQAGSDIQKLKKKLAAKGVVSIPHFAPLYKFKIMRQLGYDTAKIQKTCPVAEDLFNHRFTHLPLYDFDESQLQYLADTVIETVQQMKAGK